jgi:hypothetical protein
MRSKADLCGPRRTVSGPTVGRGTPCPPSGRQDHPACGMTALPFAVIRAIRVSPSPFRTSHFTLQIFLGPTTRQYPAIPGNTRTKVQFLAAYCRLSVRVLPRIHFSCRVLPGRRRLKSRTGILPVSGESPPGRWIPVLRLVPSNFLSPPGEFIRVYANLPGSPLNFDSPMPDHDSPRGQGLRPRF